ncbi:MAG TPA: tRNA (adenosine(37)-N6)-threonylcarbamoyltransferase complex ATPase subunit type 1 TsaE [Candidatus Limnocylindrales bacterium]|nr:tRNA (adenosine(37)-N6)-threonylcarbamoyltransferase complex ATPase subunit type 1 TsaE [Candidatus Limnocylindrales bacterium]
MSGGRPAAPAANSVPGTVHLVSGSAAATRSLAARLAAQARPGDRIGLHGPLGAGKTEFAKGFAAGLGIAAVVMSPSFTLMAEYEGRLPLFHQDLYRLAGLADAYASGLLDERQRSGVTLVEWAERLDRAVDPDRLEVSLGLGATTDEREIELTDRPGRYAGYLEAARAWSAEDR